MNVETGSDLVWLVDPAHWIIRVFGLAPVSPMATKIAAVHWSIPCLDREVTASRRHAPSVVMLQIDERGWRLMTRHVPTLRDRRAKKSWTQGHLAEASGVSLRTIQRIESGCPARADTLLALAGALDIDAGGLAATSKDEVADLFRCTPLQVLETIEEAISEARRMGFGVLETTDPGCVGLRAGRSYKILASRAHIAAVHGATVAAEMVGRVVDYLHVADLDTFIDRMGRCCDAPVVTGYGTREAVFHGRDGWMIAAELLR